MYEQENWFIFGTFRQGLDGWQLQPGPEATEPLARAERRLEGLLIEQEAPKAEAQAPPRLSMSVLRQALPDVPPNRQAVMRVRLRILQGGAQLWVRFWNESGVEIPGCHQWQAPVVSASADWQLVEFDFVVPGTTASAAAGLAVYDKCDITVASCEFRLIDDTLDAYQSRLLSKIERSCGELPSEVRDTFTRVQRHLFLPDTVPAVAYMDDAIATRFIEVDGNRVAVSSSSQPSMMALMLMDLDLKPGMRVLEIGAGTGYNAALLAQIVGAENVTSIDIDPEIVDVARANLELAGFPNIDVVAADGWQGFPKRAPYDRIIITVGVPDIAQAWFDQLADGGVIVLPLSMQCVEFTVSFLKVGDRLRAAATRGCSFMDLRGAKARSTYRRLSRGGMVKHDSMAEADLERIGEILRQTPSDVVLPNSAGDRIDDLALYLALRHPAAIGVSSPEFRRFGLPESAFLYGIADLDRMSLAVPQAVFGEPQLGVQLQKLNSEWNVLGRPGVDRLKLVAYPRTLHPDRPRVRTSPSRGVVEKPNTWLVWEFSGK
jgi:protein-L-isoaspartate(D-aspartate) O-methyltransferase